MGSTGGGIFQAMGCFSQCSIAGIDRWPPHCKYGIFVSIRILTKSEFPYLEALSDGHWICPVWHCLAPFGTVWPHVAWFSTNWPCLVLFSPGGPYLALFSRVWPSLAEFGSIWPC